MRFSCEQCNTQYAIADEKVGEKESGFGVRNVGILSRCDPSKKKQWLPNKIFDYLAAGRPIFVLGVGELARLIDGEACGLTAPTDDLETGADRLRELADADPRDLEEMGRAGRRIARERFARSMLADRMLDIFRKAAAT